MAAYEMLCGKVLPSLFPFLKPGLVERECGDKVKPKAVPCYYIEPFPNLPRDFIPVMLRYGAIFDSRRDKWSLYRFFS